MRSPSRAKDFFNRRVLGYRHFYTLSGRSLRNERNVLQKAILDYPLQGVRRKTALCIVLLFVEALAVALGPSKEMVDIQITTLIQYGFS